MITRAASVSKHLAALAKNPVLFVRTIRVLESILDTKLMNACWLPAETWPRDENGVRERMRPMREAAYMVIGAARCGPDALRSLVVMYAKDARAIIEPPLAPQANERTRREVADWSDAPSEPVPSVALGEHVLAQRNGRRFVLRTAVIERDGVAWPSVSFAVQVHREFAGWHSTRSFFIPWRAVEMVRAAIDTAITAANAANARKATHATR